MQAVVARASQRWIRRTKSNEEAHSMIARCGFAQLTERPRNPAFKDVPEGHQNSELSDASCNVGLTRRKDLTLRTDIFLAIDGEKVGLPHLLKHKRRILFGVPNRGKVCTERHVPGFAAATKELASTHSVNLPVICVTVGEPAVTDAWAKDLGVDGSDVAVAADEKTHLTRFLGLELGNEDDPSKPQSLRWAAIVDNGVLIRAFIDKTPGDLDVSSAENVLRALKKLEEAKITPST